MKSFRQLKTGHTRADRGRRLRVESLEPRVMLDADGFLIGADVHFSLSFAPDDTDIAGQSNSLAARFDAIAPRADWQETILRAFQTWAVETNSDIGVVADGGEQFGAPGLNQKDDRFGDIRIGAIAMTPEVGAVSVPVGGLVSGTWFADVVFNTAFSYTTLDDIYAVALHEAGNVFGLEDNLDPNSPLFDNGVLSATGLPPTASDLAALRQLHGTRMPDDNEEDDGVTNNDSFLNATKLDKVKITGAAEGSAPSIVYGDISDNGDQDFYRINLAGDYTGSVTIQVRSNGISLLAPEVTLFSDTQQLLQQSISTSKTGDLITLQFTAPNEDPFIRIAGADPGLFGIGGYSLTAIYDGVNQIDQATIDLIAGGQFRFLEQEDIEKFFDADEDEHFGDDDHTDDTPLVAGRLLTSPGFAEATRYEAIGSIADATDVDFYQVKSPPPAALPLNVMTVLIRSIDTGGLVPLATVYDNADQLVTSTVLANGSGDYIIQVVGVTADDNYQVKIEAVNATGPFNTGNYKLTVVYGSQVTVLEPLSAGTVGNATTKNVHTLYIGQPQLFHLALDVAATATNTPTAVVATIYDSTQTAVFQIASTPGATRSREAVLLNPGEYTVEVVPVTLDGSTPPALSYELLGTAISDLFVGDPDDPNNHPFACTEPGLEGFFCYPGGFESPDPFLWDDFVDSLNTPPDEPDLPTLVTQIFGDWWSWVWDLAGVNGPPFGEPDTIQVQATPTGALAALLLGPSGSVLDNDIDPEDGPLIALLKSGTTHGSLNFETDGTFIYTPDQGFQGRDEFTYTAFDFTQESDVATVTIIVGVSGDFDADGDSDGADFLAWQRGFGTPSKAVLTNGDSDFDGDVDNQDLGTWQQQFGQSSVPVASNSDFDGDGDFDGSDFLAWQRGFGTLIGASPADGDADADGAVNSQDLTIWQGNFGTAGSAVALASSGTQAAIAASAPNRSTPPDQFAPESLLLGNFFLEIPVPVMSTVLSGNTVSLNQPDSSESPPAIVPAQIFEPQELARMTQPRAREIAARDRLFSDIGLARFRDLRSSLRDFFSEPDFSSRID